MPRTSDSEDDTPFPRPGTWKGGKGDATTGGQFIGSESSSFKDTSPGTHSGNTSANSFLYSADAARTEEKSKGKRKKKGASNNEEGVSMTRPATGTEQTGAISEKSRSFDESRTSNVEARMAMTGQEGKDSSLGRRESFRRMGEDLVQATEQNPSTGEANPDVERNREVKGADRKQIAKDKLAKLGRIFQRAKKGVHSDEEPSGIALSEVPGTAGPSSGYLAPRSEVTFGSYSTATTTYPVSTSYPQGVARGYGQTFMTGQAFIGEEPEMDEKEKMMKERERKISHAKICESVALTVILLAGFVLGIILTAMSSMGLAFQILGPTILGLSAFGLIGKIFVTVFWEEDPYLWTKGHFCKMAASLCHKKTHGRDSSGLVGTPYMEQQLASTSAGNIPPPLHLPPPPMTSFTVSDVNNDYGGSKSPTQSFQSSYTQ